MKQELGTLLHLYLDEIEPAEPTEVHEFLIAEAAKAINEAGGRNWIPLIVKQTGAEHYKVIANNFIYAVVEAAGVDKVWCIIGDDSEVTKKCSQLLAQEAIPRIDLATATFEEIKMGLDYLIHRSINPLSGVKLALASNRIAEAPRKYWKSKLMDVTKLGCGITRGKKLNAFQEIFYVTPEPLPEVIKDISLLETSTVTELKKMAKKRNIPKYSKMKKKELIKVLAT